MSSEAQIVAKGRNAIEHGINSQIKILYNERHADYDVNTQAFIAVGRRLVDRMADCETAALIDERFENIQKPARVASYALHLLGRSQAGAYENVQRHHYERASKTLREIQKETHKKISHNEANSARPEYPQQ